MSEKQLWRVQRKELVIREFLVLAGEQSEAEEAAGELDAIEDSWDRQVDDGTIASNFVHWPSAHIVSSAECSRLNAEAAARPDAGNVYDSEQCDWVEMAAAMKGIDAK